MPDSDDTPIEDTLKGFKRRIYINVINNCMERGPVFVNFAKEIKRDFLRIPEFAEVEEIPEDNEI